eukprot:TRINITY_DN31391_c0_g1_i1.p1 TRINITY_DN31391_c0_g1~~TRINITY_DN31391_c0_g1_i1.p1  ORF type:complete len:221 (-),score=61.75 TRINITY_DN31391_c0_g1_i1:6-668(-)
MACSSFLPTYLYQGLAYTDEVGVDLWGNVILNDPLGADFGGVEVDTRDNSYWLCDKYRPSVYHFDVNGRLIERFIPLGIPTSSGVFGTPVFPAVYAQRRTGRGFSGLALDGAILYVFLQSPLDNPDTPDDAASLTSRNVRVLAFDTVTSRVTGEYVYVLSEFYNLPGRQKADSIGDVARVAAGRFFVVEGDTLDDDFSANKFLFEINFNGATNILNTTQV